MELISWEDLASVPWKNGRGVTRELARYPAGATLDNFIWRISAADVTQSGPFSIFPGIDRIITLLNGDGMCLEFADRRIHQLTTPLAPHCFRGEDPLRARLLGGPCQDLNVMLRRGAAIGKMETWRESQYIAGAARFLLLLSIKGRWKITTSDEMDYDLTQRQVLRGHCVGGDLLLRSLQSDGALLGVQVILQPVAGAEQTL